MDTSASSEAAASAEETGSSMVVGDDYNKMVQNIVDMGYDKSQVINLFQFYSQINSSIPIELHVLNNVIYPL